MNYGKRERRQYRRVTAKSGDVYHPTYKCLDFSTDGLKLLGPEKVDITSTFTVEFRALSEPITIKCSVIWCKEPASIYIEGYHIGAKFENLTITHQVEIQKLIDARG